MAGKHHLVEMLVAGRRGQHDGVGLAADRAYCRAQPHGGLPARLQRADVSRRTAAYDAPAGAALYLQHSMVGHEANQVFGREVQYSPRRRRPQCAGHRHQVVADEQLRITFGRKVVAQGRSIADYIEQGRALAIEAQDLADHSQETRRQQVASLAEHRVEVGGVVFQAAGPVVHGEAHRRRLRCHAQFVKHPGQQRIVFRVEHDEPGVDRILAPLLADAMRVRVPAQAVLAFEQHDFVVARQQPGSTQASDAAAHDRDLHCRCRRDSRIEAGIALRSQTRPTQDMALST